MWSLVRKAVLFVYKANRETKQGVPKTILVLFHYKLAVGHNVEFPKKVFVEWKKTSDEPEPLVAGEEADLDCCHTGCPGSGALGD
jgi:hypothetical protein